MLQFYWCFTFKHLQVQNWSCSVVFASLWAVNRPVRIWFCRPSWRSALQTETWKRGSRLRLEAHTFKHSFIYWFIWIASPLWTLRRFYFRFVLLQIRSDVSFIWQPPVGWQLYWFMVWSWDYHRSVSADRWVRKTPCYIRPKPDIPP